MGEYRRKLVDIKKKFEFQTITRREHTQNGSNLKWQPGLKSQRWSAVSEIWRFLAFFSSDSENTQNISADERCFRPDSALIYSESALIITHVVVRKWWKRIKWLTKWHPSYLKKIKIPHFFAELKQKLKFSAKILKVHSTKRENTFENLNHISFLIWVYKKPQKFEFVISMARKKSELIILYCSLLFSNMGWKSELCASKLR